MNPILYSLFNHPLFEDIANHLNLEKGHLTCREFPDEEIYLRIHDVMAGREVIVLDSLERPNRKIMPLLFFAKTAKALGAKRVGLCAPYLAYMRQDKRFNPGEGITSEYFADLLSNSFDWLITVDPHLHRIHKLDEIYSIPNDIVHAAGLIATWITQHINAPVLIGPDMESEQWISAVAKNIGAPYLILEKIRHGDQDVEVSKPIIQPYLKHTPVLVDDIISTAKTMLETIKHLKSAQMKPPVCIGVHGLFSRDAYQSLRESGVADVVTCNSVSHASNQIDLAPLLVASIRKFIF